MVDLSVIIVNYFSDKILKDCLQSVFTLNYNDRIEVILVNNSPEDKQLRRILLDFPHAKLIESGYNAGFARANNLGIEGAKGRFILLLNSDTVLPPGILDYFIVWMDDHNEYAMCGSSLIYPDGSPQISGNYTLKGGLNYLLQIPYLAIWGKFLEGLLLHYV
jgi:GT2 family glycosyltransferase